jgi:nitrite reductase (NO-forming)
MRRHVSWPRVLLALSGVGIVAGILLPAGSARVGHRQATTATITVTAREFSFSLSKRSVPVGTTVTFKVVNKGKITHNFAIAGKKTKNLNPGQSATLTAKFSKKGLIAYSCTLPGHAQLGMKGKFAVGVAAVAPPPPVSTPATTTHPAPTTTGSVGNAQTTVNVNMVEYAFQLSQTSIPSGQVTFVVKNSGNEVHNFDVNGVKSGALLAPGASETWTVSLAPGQYLYTCDVPFHVDRGMTGTFTVTP